MDAARGLVTKLVDEGKVREVQRAGIEPAFLDEDSAPVLNYINRHFTQYKQVPSREAVLRAFPNYEFEATEPLEYYIDQIKESYRRSILEEQLQEFGNVYTTDTVKAEQILRDTLSKLSVTSKSFKDIDLVEYAPTALEWYEKRKTEVPEDGILSGWPKMDYYTLGCHGGELIVPVGPKYVGKSWTMVWQALQALYQGERVLYTTKEMSQDAIVRRMLSIYASVCFNRLRRGELTDSEESRFKDKMNELHGLTSKLTVAKHGVSSIADIEQKAVEVDATIIFSDSVYLFPPTNDYTARNETQLRLDISRASKEMAMNLDIPVVASVQAGRKTKEGAPDLDSIEWSNAFSQDADTCFFIEKTALDAELNRRHIWLLKSRDGDITNFFAHADFEYMRFEERNDTTEPSTHIEFDEEEDEEVINYG